MVYSDTDLEHAMLVQTVAVDLVDSDPIDVVEQAQEVHCPNYGLDPSEVKLVMVLASSQHSSFGPLLSLHVGGSLLPSFSVLRA